MAPSALLRTTTTEGMLQSGISRRHAPEEPSDAELVPDVWQMPSRGIEWCDCGQHHAVDRKIVLDFAEAVVEDREWMTHDEVIDTAMDLWNYVSVCEFFLMGIRRSASAVNGGPAVKYRFERGLEIVAFFSKTGQGCPEEICSSVRDRDS
ncbi:hypothetical protein OIU93_10035 [Paeniglutamicibacter sp. ZC-3]|uniref:hypothetical protein n=1 Tax=Paeniglutamicibacter sp. ZC-3 TaxID=2986919 RepID=UPI0021F72FCB|nr:hypothetical protein [Paeniglutamicibacter sp. ZC-3]MCV9994633.1 hypothetical protein [Paeniglutamicibacter sp. ZC-3]